MLLPSPPPDPITLGQDYERLIRLGPVKKEVLVERVENGHAPFGTVRDVDLYYVVPDREYMSWLEIMSLLPRSSLVFYGCALRSTFRQQFGSAIKCFWRARRFRVLYLSVLKHGLRCDEHDVLSIPWVFAAGRSVHRVHARHRSCIARFLGIGSMRVLVITPNDLRAISELPENYRELLDGLPEPDIDLSRRPSGVPAWLAPSNDRPTKVASAA